MGSVINSSTEANETFILGGAQQLVAVSGDSETSKSLARGTGLGLEPLKLTSKFFSSINSIFIRPKIQFLA